MHESYITCEEMDLYEHEDTVKDALKTEWFFVHYTKIFHTFQKFLAVTKEKVITQLKLKNGLFDILVQDNNHVMTTINARY